MSGEVCVCECAEIDRDVSGVLRLYSAQVSLGLQYAPSLAQLHYPKFTSLPGYSLSVERVNPKFRENHDPSMEVRSDLILELLLSVICGWMDGLSALLIV